MKGAPNPVRQGRIPNRRHPAGRRVLHHLRLEAFSGQPHPHGLGLPPFQTLGDDTESVPAQDVHIHSRQPRNLPEGRFELVHGGRGQGCLHYGVSHRFAGQIYARLLSPTMK